MAKQQPKTKQIENLKPFNKLTESEQREIAQKGGIASGEVRREKKKLKETLQALMELSSAEGGTNQDRLCLALFDKALKGDVQAFTAIRDTMGEKPTDKVEQTTLQPLTPEQRKQISKDFGFE